MTMISRVLGLVRDIVLARLFGASMMADVFFVVFKIPNFLRRMFAEGAFSQAFVPVLAEYKVQRDHSAVQTLVSRVTGMLGVVLIVITVIGVLAAPVLVTIFAGGFLDEPPKFALAVDLLRITFPYILFISLTALAGGVLNTYGRFGVPAFTPVFLNLSLIVAAVWISPQMEEPITALAWGVFVAGVVQLLFQFPFLRRLNLLSLPRMVWRDEGVQKIRRLMLPALFGASITQINLLIDTLLASFLVTGSITWLYYSDRMVEFPMGVFGIALATVILPSLSKRHAADNKEAFAQTLDWGLRWVLLIGTPAMLGLLLLATPILSTLFQYGKFTGEDVMMATNSLMAYSLGLIAFILVKVLAPGYYARQDTRTPVRIGMIAVATNIILNLILIGPLAHVGLALATSLAAFVNAGLLFMGLWRQKVYRPQAGWGLLMLRVVIANGVMAALLWWGVGSAELWLEWSFIQRLERLVMLVAAAGGLYFVLLWLLGIRKRDLTSAPGKE